MSASYVALGDSFSAGIGSDTAGDQCRREGGYPVALAQRLSLDLSYQACSAAVVADVLGWQVAPLDGDTRLVTMTIGGNDAGFADVLIACAQPSWMSDGPAVVAQHLARARQVLPDRIGDLLREVRHRAPRARVLLGGYPHLFASLDCEPLTFFTTTEMDAISAATDEVDAMLAAAVDAGDEGMQYVDVRGTFAGHEVCTAEPWINGLSWPVDTSYHPTTVGHLAYVPAMGAASGLEEPQPQERPEQSDHGLPRPGGPSGVRVLDGPRRRGSGRRFRLPDLLSPESLRGAERFGLDAAEVAAVAARVPRGQRGLAPQAAPLDQDALRRLHELDRIVRDRRGRDPSSGPMAPRG